MHEHWLLLRRQRPRRTLSSAPQLVLAEGVCATGACIIGDDLGAGK